MNGAQNTPTWVAVLALAIGLVGIYWSATRAATDLAPDVLTATTTLFNCEDPSSCIVIVGGGLAGLSAAIEAADSAISAATRRGVDVTTALASPTAAREAGLPQIFLLDKERTLGGNSAKASSGQNAAGTPAQRAWEAEEGADPDSEAAFIRDTLVSCASPSDYIGSSSDSEASATAAAATGGKAGGPSPALCRAILAADPAPVAPHVSAPASTAGAAADTAAAEAAAAAVPPSMSAKVSALASESASAIAFLESHGVTPLGKLAVLGGHTHARTHRPTPGPKGAPPVGFAVTAGLRKALEQEPYRALVTVGTGVRVGGVWCAGDVAVRTVTEDPEACARVGGVWIEALPAPAAPGSAPAPAAAPAAGLSLLRAQSVILASGGYAASAAQLARWAPHVARLGLPTTNGPWATGDAIDMAMTIGASLTGLSHVQVHPTAFVAASAPSAPTKFLAPEALRGAGGLLVGLETGARFVNELGTRDHVSSHIYSTNPSHSAALILSPAAAADFGAPALGFYASKGLAALVPAQGQSWGDAVKGCLAADAAAVDGATLSKAWTTLVPGDDSANDDRAPLAVSLLCGARGILPVATATGAAVPEWLSSAARLHHDLAAYATTPAGATAYGKTIAPHAPSFAPVMVGTAGNWVVSVVTPALHYTMGGVWTDADTRVLRSMPSTPAAAAAVPVPGLFAAGEAAGGLHGRNRLGGNSLAECAVFGRRAGKAAVAEVEAAAGRKPEAAPAGL